MIETKASMKAPPAIFLVIAGTQRMLTIGLQWRFRFGAGREFGGWFAECGPFTAEWS